MPEPLQGEKWYLFQLKKLNKNSADPKKVRVEVTFESAQGATLGTLLPDAFYLTEKAISRFELLAHRAGSERAIKTEADVDVKLFSEIMGKRVWAKVVVGERFGRSALKTDGWNFRAESDPPEDELFVDYTAQDAWERAMDGL